jgi:ascorbate-specific PTS system EIIC-type component UlaA
MTEELDPRAALALAEGIRERMAARATTPAWYAPLYGLFSGLFVAGVGLPQPLGIVIIAFALVALGLLYYRWTQLSGLIVTGYRAGATRAIAAALTFALVGLALASLALRVRLGLVWGPLVCGLVAGLIAAFASAAWDRAWRADIRRGGGQ